MPECYFNDGALGCQGDLWQCKTCGEWFCQTHFHVTDKGRNVECVACEENTPDFVKQYGRHDRPPFDTVS